MKTQTAVKCDCGILINHNDSPGEGEWNYSCPSCKQDFFVNEFEGMKLEQLKLED